MQGIVHRALNKSKTDQIGSIKNVGIFHKSVNKQPALSTSDRFKILLNEILIEQAKPCVSDWRSVTFGRNYEHSFERRSIGVSGSVRKPWPDVELKTHLGDECGSFPKIREGIFKLRIRHWVGLQHFQFAHNYPLYRYVGRIDVDHGIGASLRRVSGDPGGSRCVDGGYVSARDSTESLQRDEASTDGGEKEHPVRPDGREESAPQGWPDVIAEALPPTLGIALGCGFLSRGYRNSRRRLGRGWRWRRIKSVVWLFCGGALLLIPGGW